MNYNILSYALYALLAIFIIVKIGRLFHRNGRIFILTLFQNKEQITDTTNNLLLIAYYLFNIGYSILQFSFWGNVPDFNTVIVSITSKIGILILLLAALHYNNMLIIYLLSKNKSSLFTFKQ